MRLRSLLPVAAAGALAVSPAASAAVSHSVARGESLYSIAQIDGVSVSQLAAANGLSSGSRLLAGSTLVIPARSTAGVGSTVYADSRYARGVAGYHGDGDSNDVAASSSRTVYSSRVGGRTMTATAYSQPVGAVAEGSPTAPPYPTNERVTAGQIGAIASANGVPSSLAEAIAWEESGFNNALVSVADARGVMQILPGTWDWIQRTLRRGAPPLAPASAYDNVRGGVLLLGSLLRSTGSPTLAAAGYYQGLPSVRRRGLYPSTQHYVSNVLALQRRFGGS